MAPVPASQPLPGRYGSTGGQSLYVVIAQLRRLRETRCAVFAGDVNAVRHQDVIVRVEIERRAKPLHEAHRTTAAAGVAQLLGLPPIPAVDDAEKDRKTALTNLPSQARR